MNMLKPSTQVYIKRINKCQTLAAARKRVTQHDCCSFFALLLRGRFEPAAFLVLLADALPLLLPLLADAAAARTKSFWG